MASSPSILETVVEECKTSDAFSNAQLDPSFWIKIFEFLAELFGDCEAPPETVEKRVRERRPLAEGVARRKLRRSIGRPAFRKYGDDLLKEMSQSADALPAGDIAKVAKDIFA